MQFFILELTHQQNNNIYTHTHTHTYTHKIIELIVIYNTHLAYCEAFSSNARNDTERDKTKQRPHLFSAVPSKCWVAG